MNEQTTTNTAAHNEPLAVLPPVDDDAAGREAVREKMADALTPGFQVEFDPDDVQWSILGERWNRMITDILPVTGIRPFTNHLLTAADDALADLPA